MWLSFKSRQVMAGLFGPNSFASSFPRQQDLYVEKLLSLDSHGRVQGWVEDSAGALVKMENLDRIEFFEVEGVMPRLTRRPFRESNKVIGLRMISFVGTSQRSP